MNHTAHTPDFIKQRYVFITPFVYRIWEANRHSHYWMSLCAYVHLREIRADEQCISGR